MTKKKLYIQSSYWNKPEGRALSNSKRFLPAEHSKDFAHLSKEEKENGIFYGSVEFMDSLFNLPDFNPYTCGMMEGGGPHRACGDSLQDLRFRNPFDIVFVKPKKCKAFASQPFFVHELRARGKEDFYWSEYREFVHEWRAYIVDGKVVDNYCYRSLGDKFIDIKLSPVGSIPYSDKGVYAVDYGIYIDRDGNAKVDLIESHPAYSIGWYGGDEFGEDFAEFVEKGWAHLKEMGMTAK